VNRVTGRKPKRPTRIGRLSSLTIVTDGQLGCSGEAVGDQRGVVAATTVLGPDGRQQQHVRAVDDDLAADRDGRAVRRARRRSGSARRRGPPDRTASSGRPPR
jgi:hypothetical protein